MTTELKSYIDGLLIQVYRMVDGSVVMAEESHRDNVDGYVVLRRPLQVCQVVMEDSLKTAFIPWIPGGDDHVRVSLDSVIAETDASFDQKYAYSRFYLLEHLQKYLSPTEFKEAVDQVAKDSKPSQKSLTGLKMNLTKGKRFHLN